MWKDHLHFELLGEHVLFPGLHLDNFGEFLVASLLTIVLCLSERYCSFYLVALRHSEVLTIFSDYY